MNSKSTLKKLWSYFSANEKIKFARLIILTVVASFAELLTLASIPVLLYIGNSENFEQLSNFNPFIATIPNPLVASSIIFIILLLLSAWIKIKLIERNADYSCNIGHALAVNATQSILSQELTWIRGIQKSQLISLVSEDMNKAVFGVKGIVSFITSSFLVMTILLYTITVDFVNLCIIFATIFVYYYVILRKNGINIERYGKAQMNSFNQSISLFGGIIDSFKEIILADNSKYFVDHYSKLVKSYRNSDKMTTILANSPRVSLETIVVCCFIIVIVVTIQTSNSAEQELAKLVTLFFAMTRILRPAFGAYAGISAYLAGINQLNKILNIINLRTAKSAAIKNESSKLTVHELQNNPFHEFQELELQSVCYSYNTETKDETSLTKRSLFSLNDISLRIKKSTSYSLVGKSGCGKSTIMDIMLGLIPPSKGRVLVNGLDIYSSSEINMLWRRSLSHIPQQAFLIDGTLDENIIFGSYEDLCKSKLIYSKKASLVNDFTSNSNLLIQSNGSQLSGGQRQRIGIARALYRSNCILFLDESTSALDNIAESKIIENITESMEEYNSSLILISHSMNAIKKCDNIILIDEGRVIDGGTYSELMSKSDYFRNLKKGFSFNENQ